LQVSALDYDFEALVYIAVFY